ncbi:phosphotransferase [uncultured Arthrobacter sp.]|uniref:phosphotransferase n=1 Tax=uncultured Arthrobacter sp. TaxID=114050 RepID=UPI002623F905|nr:phosphotransferase [uncultured Arthrobacter sp.]
MTARTQHQPLQPENLVTSTESDRCIAVRASAGPALWARGVLAEAAPTLVGELTGLRVLREGPKRLAVLELSHGREVVLKQYSDDRGAWTRRWLQRLVEAGFTPPARFAVTPPRGWSGTHRTLVTDLALGRAWAGSLLHAVADRDAAAIAAADWVSELQSVSVALPDRTGYRAGDELCRQSRLLAESYPGHAARLLRIADSIERRLYSAAYRPGPDLVASHGDLHPDNLYLADGGQNAVTAIDVDTAGLRRPSYDVGYALAHLLIFSWMRAGSFAGGAGAGLAFWQRWTAGRGADADAVPAEVARALVQSLHHELITYRTGCTGLLDRWLDVAEAVLVGGITATFEALATEQEVTP